MRQAAIFLATGVAGLFLKRSGPEDDYTKAVPLAEPEGIVTVAQDGAGNVECEDPDIYHYEKVIFARVMGCNRQGDDAESLCNNFVAGGCDNEHCHTICHKMYTSQETYKTCKCKDWTAATFKEHSPGNMCPLKVQPRCLNGNLYRTECEALKANPGSGAGDLVVVPVSDWPEGDMAPVKETHSVCAT